MKTLLLTCLLLFALKPENGNILSVEISFKTRGTSKIIVIDKSKMLYSLNEEVKTFHLKDAQWKKVFNAAAKLPPGKISRIKGESDKQQVDAAFMTQITIRTEKKTYSSVMFDDSNPPREFIGLIKSIKNILSEFGSDL